MNAPEQARPDDLAGKVAIIAGAGSRASGIGNGRAAAVLLAQSGMKVALVDSVAENMTETRELVEGAGGECLVLPADVSRVEDCEAVVAAVVDAWGGVDVLFNNVGIVGPSGSVVDVDLDAWDRCFDINVTSMVLMSRFVIPHMRKRGGGSIINTSSIAGVLGAHPSVIYSATKGAVTNLTRAMAAMHGPEGIRVNALVPGFLHTPMVHSQGLSEEDRVRRRNVAPVGAGGVEGSGWDVGELVRFLASDRARFISGTNIPVDGGLAAVIPMTDSMSVTAPVDGS
ncbi:SDR family oxidoreductase [Nocardioides sp. WL0053]|uniref:SDR family oxidoreductase n=1 Tax=Nocardioides jiangsuensis TaxID=2866161 RepID=A0ABS7RHY2_9ACTN|nr:SDR family oxidoreductase [Nocardioides jiangsuensis]MBY9074631.1 SDR family oxidoreductase [Nocardioides jiangsuensis]